MKIHRATLLQKQWHEFLSSWQKVQLPEPLLHTQLKNSGVQFLLPVGTGAGLRPGGETVVRCDIVAFKQRPCMLISVGEPGRTTHLDSISIKKILRAQEIAIRGGIAIAYSWAGICDITSDDAEVFPDVDAAGMILSRCGLAQRSGIPQFNLSNQNETSGTFPAMFDAAVLSGNGASGFFEESLAWLERLNSLKGAQALEPGPEPSEVMPLNPSEEYDTRDVVETLVDAGSFTEYRKEFGRTVICGYASIGTLPVGVVANQRRHVREPGRAFEFGGVIYPESADKGARFIIDCNQNGLPILFLQDVNGFMVGREAEIAGIIRSGAKMVNAVANSVVPKITLILGGSYGAGNYAMCGKAYDPLFIFGWPTARYAVMGGDQAARTLSQLQIKQAESEGITLTAAEREGLFDRVKDSYDDQLDPRYAAARLWIDEVIYPADTRTILFRAVQVAHYAPLRREFKLGVFQT